MDSIPDIVDIVLYFLGVLSMIVWALILIKAIMWLKLGSSGKKFLAQFANIRRIQELPALSKNSKSTFARLCQVGMHSLETVRANPALAKPERREVVLQALRQQAYLEQRRLDNGLVILASIGSTAPFIGLFGTVWGIMNALKRITATGSAGLDVVAGPIGEALIATAIGIATAIPAVLAYNYFMRKLKTHNADMEQVAAQFQSLVTQSGAES